MAEPKKPRIQSDRNAITADMIHRALTYDPATGIFIWNVRSDVLARWNTRYAGKVAGSLAAKGYWRIAWAGVRMYAHRAAWLYMTGKLPQHEIDHINGDRMDNRFANLRQATSTENHRNMRLHTRNKSGFKGVSPHSRGGGWCAFIHIDGKANYLGVFDTPEEAHAAYCVEATKRFGEFARFK